MYSCKGQVHLWAICHGSGLSDSYRGPFCSVIISMDSYSQERFHVLKPLFMWQQYCLHRFDKPKASFYASTNRTIYLSRESVLFTLNISSLQVSIANISRNAVNLLPCTLCIIWETEEGQTTLSSNLHGKRQLDWRCNCNSHSAITSRRCYVWQRIKNHGCASVTRTACWTVASSDLSAWAANARRPRCCHPGMQASTSCGTRRAVTGRSWLRLSGAFSVLTACATVPYHCKPCKRLPTLPQRQLRCASVPKPYRIVLSGEAISTGCADSICTTVLLRLVSRSLLLHQLRRRTYSRFTFPRTRIPCARWWRISSLSRILPAGLSAYCSHAGRHEVTLRALGPRR